jgi:hypothetical protein
MACRSIEMASHRLGLVLNWYNYGYVKIQLYETAKYFLELDTPLHVRFKKKESPFGE